MIARTITLAAAAALLALPARAADPAALKAEAAGVVKQFGGTLKTTLETAIKADGPVHAIGVCNEKAPQIAANVGAANGWQVGRTSLRLRNAKNKPDAWEAKVLGQFEERKAKGEDPEQLVAAEIVEDGGKQVFRFMKAIPTAELCLGCHGSEIHPDVAAKLGTLYPEDKGRGFKVRDLRGAFTLRKAL
jgi:hypothetical protein